MKQQLDPVTGPIPREEFTAIVDLPHGKARDAIRKYDPLWQRQPGEKIKWTVKFSRRRAHSTGVATIEAATEKEALKLAETLPDYDIDWDDDFDDVEVESAEPKR